MHADDYELLVVEDTTRFIVEELGYSMDDVIKDDYSLNRFKYQYTIASSITLRLIGPELKSGHHSCQLELKGEGCREWECHNKDKTWKDFLELFIVKLNANVTRIDLTIDDYEGKDVDLDFIRYKMDNNFYTTTFRDKKYIIHGNDLYGYTLALGSHDSTQELCIYEKNKEQRRKKGYCVQPYWLRYEMRYRREKAYDVAMNLVNLDYDKYSEFFYGLLYQMLDLKQDNTYDDNNQYKIATDSRWTSFLNNVSKCKLKKYQTRKDLAINRYMEWAKPIICKCILYACLYFGNIDDAVVELLKATNIKDFKNSYLDPLNEFLKSLGGKPKTFSDLDEIQYEIKNRIDFFEEYCKGGKDSNILDDTFINLKDDDKKE